MESKLKSLSKYFHNKLSCQLKQRHLKQGDTWRREKPEEERNLKERDPPEPSSPGRVAAWWTPNWLIPSSLFIENYQCRQLPISMGFAVTCLSSLPHSLWIIDSLQFCEFSLIVFHFPAPPTSNCNVNQLSELPKKVKFVWRTATAKAHLQLYLQLQIHLYLWDTSHSTGAFAVYRCHSPYEFKYNRRRATETASTVGPSQVPPLPLRFWSLSLLLLCVRVCCN